MRVGIRAEHLRARSVRRVPSVAYTTACHASPAPYPGLYRHPTPSRCIYSVQPTTVRRAHLDSTRWNDVGGVECAGAGSPTETRVYPASRARHRTDSTAAAAAARDRFGCLGGSGYVEHGAWSMEYGIWNNSIGAGRWAWGLYRGFGARYEAPAPKHLT